MILFIESLHVHERSPFGKRLSMSTQFTFSEVLLLLIFWWLKFTKNLKFMFYGLKTHGSFEIVERDDISNSPHKSFEVLKRREGKMCKCCLAFKFQPFSWRKTEAKLVSGDLLKELNPCTAPQVTLFTLIRIDIQILRTTSARTNKKHKLYSRNPNHFRTTLRR